MSNFLFTLTVGDRVFLLPHPYYHWSLSILLVNILRNLLWFTYCGLFTITARAVPVAYPLDLFLITSIHIVLNEALDLPFWSLIPHELLFHEAVWEYFDRLLK